MPTSTDLPPLNPEFQAFVTTTEIPSPARCRSRFDRVKEVTVQDLLEFIYTKEAAIVALLPTTTGLEAEAYQLFFRNCVSEGQTVYRLAGELIDKAMKDEKRSSDQPDSTPSPGMA